MRRLLALLGGLVLARAWLARRRAREAPAAPPGLDPRAGELRRRLDESRALAEEPEDFTSGETPVDAEERRRDVHARGRSAIDEMRGDARDE
jgi:hypothetical protein